ncbi:MAG: porin [Bacteroidota bacterium]
MAFRGCIALLVALAFVLSLPSASQAQVQNQVKTRAGTFDLLVQGGFQPRFSYAVVNGEDEDQTRVGFGIRRARLQLIGSLDSKFGVHYDGEFTGGTLGSVDLFAFYQPNEQWRFRLGVMPSAQPRGHIYTPFALIDGIDRPVIAERWASNTLGGAARDFGVEAQYTAEQAIVNVFFGNGDGGFSRTQGNFREAPSGSSVTSDTETEGLEAGAVLRFMPASMSGFEFGGHAAINAAKNPNTRLANNAGRTFASYSAHAYYGANPGSQPVRVKLEAIAINFQESENAPFDDSANHLGLAAFGAVGAFANGELYARLETYDADAPAGADTYITVGATYSLSAAEGLPFEKARITFGYTYEQPGLEAAPDEHIAAVQMQLIF